MNNIKRLVLGAMDPEMEAIKTLADWAGVCVVQATFEGKPVHPGNAYKADAPELQEHDLWVECAFNENVEVFFSQHSGCVSWWHTGDESLTVERLGWSSIKRNKMVAIADHHRPGDSGYGKGPEEYFSASSVGQVAMIIAGQEDPERAIRQILCKALEGKVSVYDNGCKTPGQFITDAVQLLKMVAAADHCPGAAYQGKCLGVDPQALMEWRAETRAAFQKRSVEEVLADVEKARIILSEYLVENEYADLRGMSIPELPEAALRDGVAFISTTKDRDGRDKVGIGGNADNQEELVRRFMAGELVTGLVDIYGDPARGFAGGYIKN